MNLLLAILFHFTFKDGKSNFLWVGHPNYTSSEQFICYNLDLERNWQVIDDWWIDHYQLLMVFNSKNQKEF